MNSIATELIFAEKRMIRYVLLLAVNHYSAPSS